MKGEEAMYPRDILRIVRRSGEICCAQVVGIFCQVSDLAGSGFRGDEAWFGGVGGDCGAFDCHVGETAALGK